MLLLRHQRSYASIHLSTLSHREYSHENTNAARNPTALCDNRSCSHVGELSSGVDRMPKNATAARAIRTDTRIMDFIIVVDFYQFVRVTNIVRSSRLDFVEYCRSIITPSSEACVRTLFSCLIGNEIVCPIFILVRAGRILI